jgi:WhiB family transcriptional regulator, redox-sensing transcriptional regulator
MSDDVLWQSRGLCRDGSHDPNLWYPENPQAQYKSLVAIEICYECPVIAQCREWALTKREVYGVWGGLSENDRSCIWSGRIPRRGYLRQRQRRGTPRRRFPAVS